MIYPSIDMRGDWELNDLTTVEESFQQGDLRDGLGLLKWVQSFYDLTSDSGQIKARDAYSKFKFTIDMGVGQLQKTLLATCAAWRGARSRQAVAAPEWSGAPGLLGAAYRAEGSPPVRARGASLRGGRGGLLVCLAHIHDTYASGSTHDSALHRTRAPT